MADSKDPPNPKVFMASLDPGEWIPSIIPFERIDVVKYTRDVERKIKRSKTISTKLRYLRYHREDLSHVLAMSRSRVQKLEEEGNVDNPESYWDYHEELENAIRVFSLREEALLIESSTIAPHQIADQQRNTRILSSIQSPQPNPIGSLGEFMWIEDVASYLKLSKSTIRQKCDKGEISCSKVGKRLRFRKSEIDRWAIEQENLRKGKLKH
jgi:excisionase family DNA binding protein